MTEQNKTNILVYVGCYTHESPNGLNLFSMDLNSGELSSLNHGIEQTNASYIAIDSNRMRLYAVSEIEEGAVFSYKIDPATGHLTFLNQQPTYGGAPCHLSIDQTGSCVYVANYSKGNVCVYPIQEDGSLAEASDIHQHEGQSLDEDRQEKAHAHMISPDFNNRFAVAADLGLDQLVIYDMDVAGKKLIAHKEVHIQAGAGPRHFAFRQDGSFLYAVNELNSTVTVLAYDAEQGNAATIQTVTTIPRDYDAVNYCADIHLSKDGSFLYASNRGHDSLAAYSIDKDQGTLTPIGHYSTLGKTPRNFVLTPDGEYVLVANQETDDIVVFKLDKATGELTDTGHRAQVSRPICVKLLEI
ncbi:lactonase family protein [Paenibacillus eucommiae]|uniref:6-phosphogluconolactonase n=1 Tax=Paenibacillus eucommiae TaxID=1355755 RepID=A0ABS4J8S7_9BACL|nr:lactonase family protein [Paenibacillus eucommiae]MBP1995665.1 6-phosphogluconolactonase [Paenibacillus eucommiae]